MQQSAIFTPFFCMLLLTFMVWVYMYYKRIPFLQNCGIDLQDLTKSKIEEISPAAVSNPSDNLKNLFEIPVLFYALTLYLFVTASVDGIYVAAAWVFVMFRALHSLMQCTRNIIMVRFTLYMISSAAVWFIALRASIQHFGS